MPRSIQYDTSDEIVRAVTNNNLRKKSDLSFFERALMNRDIIPRSYFEKRSRPEAVLEAQASLVHEGIIDVQQDLWFWYGAIGVEPREGRAPHPKHYHPPKNRNQVNINMTRRDRNLLYYIGNESIPVGLVHACAFIRRNRRLFQEQYPCEIGPEGL